MDYKDKAIRSAATWNSTFNRSRRDHRRCCFDLQSFTIHYPRNRLAKTLPKEPTKPGSYPLALIPGQFTDFYKRWLQFHCWCTYFKVHKSHAYVICFHTYPAHITSCFVLQLYSNRAKVFPIEHCCVWPNEAQWEARARCWFRWQSVGLWWHQFIWWLKVESM